MMDQATKELLYKGLGIALMVKDKFSKEFDEIIQEGELSKEEIKKAAFEAKGKAENEKQIFEDKMREKVKSIVDDLGLATKKDIEELKELIKNK